MTDLIDSSPTLPIVGPSSVICRLKTLSGLIDRFMRLKSDNSLKVP